MHELRSLGRARVLLIEQLDEAAEAEDRRAELVGGVGDELLTGAVELGEPALHLVEGAGQRAELSGRGDRDRRLEVAVGDFPRRLLQPADAPRGDAGEIDADEERGDDGEDAADQDLGFDRAVAAGGAPDRDRVDVYDEHGRDGDRNRGDRDPVAQRRRP